MGNIFQKEDIIWNISCIQKNVFFFYFMIMLTKDILVTLINCVWTENELGETALDVSRRLKHSQCEELVS